MFGYILFKNQEITFALAHFRASITGVDSVCSDLVCSGVFGLVSGMKSDMEKLYYFSLSLSPLGEVYLHSL